MDSGAGNESGDPGYTFRDVEEETMHIFFLMDVDVKEDEWLGIWVILVMTHEDP